MEGVQVLAALRQRLRVREVDSMEGRHYSSSAAERTEWA